MSQDFGGPAGSSAVPTAEGSVYSEHSANGAGPTGLQEFNAWGPDGVMHRVTKAPTVISEVSTHTTKSTVTVTPSGWVKPVSGVQYLVVDLFLISIRACARLRPMRRVISNSAAATLPTTTTTTVRMERVMTRSEVCLLVIADLEESWRHCRVMHGVGDPCAVKRGREDSFALRCHVAVLSLGKLH